MLETGRRAAIIVFAARERLEKNQMSPIIARQDRARSERGGCCGVDYGRDKDQREGRLVWFKPSATDSF